MKKAILILIIYVCTFNTYAEVTLAEFQKLVQVFHQEYDQELKLKNEAFIVNPTTPPTDPNMWWNLPTVRASYSSYTENGIRYHYLFVLGGYVKIPGMNLEGLAHTLCHELGHGIGGAPYKVKTESYVVSAEGQADYYASKVCIKRILKRLPVTKTPSAVDGYVDGLCRKHFKTTEDLNMCFRSFDVLEVERIFLEKQEIGGSKTYYDRPDQKVVSQINTAADFYPANQCRLDTMVRGVLGLERPRCWWKP